MKHYRFSCSEKVVYPGYGVAQISSIFERVVGQVTVSFYELVFCGQGTTIFVPTNAADQVGLRALSCDRVVAEALLVISQPSRKVYHHELSASSWNKRHKQYQAKMRRGSLVELSEIYRDLTTIQRQKELSFGEKSLLLKTESLLVEEISLIQSNSVHTMTTKLRALSREVSLP